MTFREFWPLYLQAHSHPTTRAVHYAATVVGVGAALTAALTLQPAFLLGIGIAYGIAIGAHAFIEKNRSMIRVNPVWGAVADLRMFWLAVTGGLQRELDRAGRTRASRAMPARSTASFPAA
ncbi:Mpo1-like protein [Dongia sp. agr-C8]